MQDNNRKWKLLHVFGASCIKLLSALEILILAHIYVFCVSCIQILVQYVAGAYFKRQPLVQVFV